MEDITLVIENCEARLLTWLWLEYKHCAQIWDNLIFTNIKDEEMARGLQKIGKTYRQSFNEIFDPSEMIILDPLAEEGLKSADFKDATTVIVGGILGYEIPKSRTSMLITAKARDAKICNLGKIQLTIDSAVLVTKLIYLGVNLKDMQITQGIEIKHSEYETTTLPYGYVVIENKVIITPGLVEYLSEGTPYPSL